MVNVNGNTYNFIELLKFSLLTEFPLLNFNFWFKIILWFFVLLWFFLLTTYTSFVKLSLVIKNNWIWCSHMLFQYVITIFYSHMLFPHAIRMFIPLCYLHMFFEYINFHMLFQYVILICYSHVISLCYSYILLFSYAIYICYCPYLPIALGNEHIGENILASWPCWKRYQQVRVYLT